MSDKVGRDAFLYLAPGKGKPQDHAQCGPCRMFVPGEALKDSKLKGGRCIIHGAFVDVDEDDSCGFYVPWPLGLPVETVVRDHAAELKKMIPGSVTPEESGLVDRRVQCHRCRFAEKEAKACGLYLRLNEALPEAFALDPNIEPHACCNAQTPPDPKRERHRLKYRAKKR